MQLYQDEKLTIFFGDSKSSPITIQKCRELESKFVVQDLIVKEISKIEYFDSNKLFFLDQTHSTDHIIISGNNIDLVKSFRYRGDFIVTDQVNVCIGVLTADCLPIIFFDKIKKILAIAHAGWKGSVSNIVGHTLNSMKNNFGSEPVNIQITFAANAKSCCYEVSKDFVDNLDSSLVDSSIKVNNEKIYFDLANYNKLLLLKSNIPEENINTNYNICTICNLDYCSYRRNKELSGLQMTIVKMNK